MKVYMYSKEEAKRNAAIYKLNPMLWFLVWFFIIIGLLFFLIFLSSYIRVYWNPKLLAKISSYMLWIIYLAISIVSLRFFLKQLKIFYWGENIAFIKENGIMWAVKLVYIHFAEIPMADVPYSYNEALKSAAENKMLSDELKERRKYEQNFIKALEDAKEEKNIFKDIDKNFTFIFNGAEAVIRLDNIEFKSEKKKTEIYTYTDYKGKTSFIEIPKAFPGLKEEIANTSHIINNNPFPSKYENKITKNPMAIFLILIFITVCIPLFYLIIMDLMH